MNKAKKDAEASIENKKGHGFKLLGFSLFMITYKMEILISFYTLSTIMHQVVAQLKVIDRQVFSESTC